MSLKPWEVYERKFCLFGNLPVEVQNMIWQIAIYDVKPRIVQVKENSIPSTRRSTYFNRREFISACPIPGVLHACRASRSLALRRWRQSFAASRQPAKIFFDFSCDILFIPEDLGLANFAKRVDPVDRVRLNRLAISIKDLRNNLYPHDGFGLAYLLIKEFPSLTRLTFPEVNLDAVRAEEAEFRLAQRRLAKSRPFGSRRRRTQPKPNPRKMIIQWYEADIASRQVEVPVAAAMRMMDFAYRTLTHTCPEMKRVDYGTLDLELVEYNEDQRRLDRAEAMRQVENVWEQVERQRLAGTESNSST
jgi:hypothetical protein